ncbi:MAG: type II toxin-antitoxin system VapC family toxin [Candidatus Dormibacteria bacterium]
MIWYLDTSAFLKLTTKEAESKAISDWYSTNGPCWSSQLLLTEATRAGARLGLGQELVATALDTVGLVVPSATTYFAAARPPRPELRSLDALHLPAGIEIGADLEGMAVCDPRLKAVAEAQAIFTVTPT